MNAQQVPQCKQRRVTYLLTYIMSETRHGYKLLFDCIFCVYVIQWYTESCKMLFIWKKVDVKKKKKKKKKKKSEQHRVLSASTCVSNLDSSVKLYLINLIAVDIIDNYSD